jgi:hypothetical protein
MIQTLFTTDSLTTARPATPAFVTAAGSIALTLVFRRREPLE